MRLAEHVAHTTDVDAMLASMTPDQFSEWCAKDRIEPIGNEATRMTLALLGCLVSTFGSKEEPELRWFMPWLEKQKAVVKTWAQVMERKGRA